MREIDKAIARHDAAVSDAGLDIWIGSEPTFTLRRSEEPQWLSQALGGDKARYALRMTRELARRHPGCVVLRSVGRQYGGEKRPRWSFGLYERRDHTPLWQGPPDPVLLDEIVADDGALMRLVAELEQGFTTAGWACRVLQAQHSSQELRLLMCLDSQALDEIDDHDPRLMRAKLHEQKTPQQGLQDSLADEGYFLFLFSIESDEEDASVLCLDLPALPQVDSFLQCLDILSAAAARAKLSHLLLQGYPPPVDNSVAWTTITPDPAVIEVNQAPQPNVAAFQAANRELFEVAGLQGLSPYRLQYNGTISDSGGGGQFTLGGPTALGSPFFEQPKLLPRLVRYFNQHPALSYWFATNYVGATSQSPRADENTLDSFHELSIALDQLNSSEDISPEFLHLSLAPFLADSSGNSHRSELNIEKLWNTWLPQRGCLGLLEFRGFRMSPTPERAVAIAILLRAICAMLANHDPVPDLHSWKEELHDRFALPYFLRRDLNVVLDDLERCGFGVADQLRAQLLGSPDRPAWTVDFAGCQLSIEPAVEFWPLVGDVASQERGGSRLVDSSTLRLQFCLRALADGDANLNDIELSVAGCSVPLREQRDDSGALRLIGLRYRDFVPWRGLHPLIKPTSPLILYLAHAKKPEALQLTLHNWRADGIPYDGLPGDIPDAVSRCMERLLVRSIDKDKLPATRPAPARALKEFLFDLRCV
jgi:uncharacterized protein (DUF2126 family)